MKKTEFYSELESMLELEAGTVKGDEVLANLPGWDSVAVLSFIILADSKLGESISAAALVRALTVTDLVKLFPNKIA